MRTELPAERLHRRLTGVTGSDEPVLDDDQDPKSLLPRWQPETAQSWTERVRADPGRAGAVLLALIAAIAVLITIFTLLRDRSAPVVAAKLPPVEMVSSAGTGPPAEADRPVVVSVVGLVHTPGLVTLAPGSRIADALHAAGDPLEGADTVGLNLARQVADGEQIVVGIAARPGLPPALGSSVSSGSPQAGPPGVSTPAATTSGQPGAPVDLNTATVEQLDALPGVGPVTAAAIVAWREAHGSFSGVDQLGEVDGIGPARLAKLRALVCV